MVAEFFLIWVRSERRVVCVCCVRERVRNCNVGSGPFVLLGSVLVFR
jgi:hypothetical protein